MISGIYVIVHHSSGRCYVGSSADLKKRWGVHLHHLRSGTHGCVQLQRVWSKHGERSFGFFLMERCRPSLLTRRERWWIAELDALQPDGFNSIPDPVTGRGWKMRPSTVEKIRAAAVRRGADPAERARRSRLAKEQHAARKLGRATWKSGTKPVLSEAARAKFARWMRQHVASQSSAEMSRRSYCRKIFQ